MYHWQRRSAFRVPDLERRAAGVGALNRRAVRVRAAVAGTRPRRRNAQRRLGDLTTCSERRRAGAGYNPPECLAMVRLDAPPDLESERAYWALCERERAFLDDTLVLQ
jgi:hypothetical protein